MAVTQEPGDFYDAARALVPGGGTATLATAQDGVPHAALVTVALLPGLAPVLLLSELAVHTQQLLANPVCALLFAGEPNGPNPQTRQRLCLTGDAGRSNDPRARAVFLERHPYAAQYADFGDFAFWEVAVRNAYFVGGFGAARKLAVAKLAAGT
jgi:putative heme iron utilization protein